MSWTCVSKCGDPNIVHVWLKVKTAGIAVLWGDVQKGRKRWREEATSQTLLPLACPRCQSSTRINWRWAFG
eukprot:symbB.v1.2.007462.t1/scaffold455.1/size335105/10